MMSRVNIFQTQDTGAPIMNVIGVIIKKIRIGDFTPKINKTSLVVNLAWRCVTRMRDAQV